MKTTRLLSMIMVAAFGLLMWQAPAAAEEPAPPKQDEAKKDEAPAHKAGKKKAEEKEEKKEEAKPGDKPAPKP
jgi:cytoskeletal protein RodZ